MPTMPGRGNLPGTLMRFSIRDVLWLIALSAMAALLWRDRLALKNERELLLKEVTAQKAALGADRAKLNEERETFHGALLTLAPRAASLDPALRALIANVVNRMKPHLSDKELERIKRDSAALGAPQPAPLPPGFGEKHD